MKKILFLLLFPALLYAQLHPFPVDTTPQWSYMFYGDSVKFIQNEYLVRIELIDGGGIMSHWCYPSIDTTTHSVYLCETPSPDRMVRIKALEPIYPVIVAFAQGQANLLELKLAAQASDIPQEYKELVYSITLVNKKKYKVNTNFNNFKLF